MHNHYNLSPGALNPLRSLKSVASIFFLACLLWVSTISPLLAQTTLVKDIWTGLGGSGPAYLTVVGNTLYFQAAETTNGQELWRSDGTAAGTVLVKDINPGSNGSAPYSLVVMGSYVYFFANDGTNGTELWRTNGTEAGTVLVKNIRPGSDGSSPSNLTVMGGYLYFSANDGTNGRELWKSDGTEAGTVLVKNIRPGSDDSDPYNLKVMGGTLYFVTNDGTNGNELWKSDGTTAGTVLVKDINQGSNNSGPEYLTVMGNTLYFQANDGTNGQELWKSDGTATGTVLVKDISTGANGSVPAHLTVIGSHFYFRAGDTSIGYELWKSDGTEAGTVLVKDIYPGNNGSFPEYFTVMGNTLYFKAGDDTNGTELWKSDGTTAGTVLVKDINTSYNSSSDPANLMVLGSTLYFSATDGTNGTELWKSDGTTAGTVLFKDINPGSNGSSPYNLTVMGNSLYFVANDGTNGPELWKSSEPRITPSTASLLPFSTCAGIASAEQSFTVSGTNLTAAIAVTAPTGFGVSTSSGSGFGATTTLPSSGGTVYVRLTATAIGSPSGNITLASMGATTQSVAASGMVSANSVPNASSNSPVCVGSSIRLSGTGGSSYTWAGPGSFSSNLQNPSRLNATLAMSGVYSLTVSNTCGTATASTSVVVSPNVAPSITSLRINGSLPSAQTNAVGVCSSSPVTLTVAATNAVQYSWRGPTGAGSGFVSSLVSPVDLPIPTARQGQYTVTVRNGCTVFNQRVINLQFVNCATRLASAEEASLGLDLSLAPNPLREVLEVNVRGIEGESLQLGIHDAQGRSLQQVSIEAAEGKAQHRFDLRSLPAGMYLLQAESNSQRASKKVIKVD